MGRMTRHRRLRCRLVVCKHCHFPGGIRGFQPLRRIGDARGRFATYEHDKTKEGAGCDWVGRTRQTLSEGIASAKERIKGLLGLTPTGTGAPSPTEP